MEPAGHSISTWWIKLFDHAPFLHARGLAAKLDRQLHPDHFIGGDAGEIDVHHVGAPGVPLQLADEGRFADRPGQTRPGGCRAAWRSRGFGGDGQGHLLQAVPIQDGRDAPGAAKPPAVVFSPSFTGRYAKLFRHHFLEMPLLVDKRAHKSALVSVRPIDIKSFPDTCSPTAPGLMP